MPINRVASYTAADSVPIKLFLNEGIAELRPIHVQWMPTNACNLRCNWCSCSERDQSLQMDLPTALEVIHDLAKLGCLAATVTGGGEPICHPHLPEMIQAFHENNIAVGLVTNGLLLDKLSLATLSLLTWCRISNGDNRRLTRKYEETLETAVQAKVDWAFSHVVSREPNYDEILRIVRFANNHNFTHVRLVSDLLDAENVPMESVRERLAGIDERVIYQSRQHPEAGGDCLIGYVKPLIGPDFKVFSCCGLMYAFDPKPRSLPESMVIGDARDLQAMYSKQEAQHFGCKYCFYMNYNRILSALTSEVKHKEFI